MWFDDLFGRYLERLAFHYLIGLLLHEHNKMVVEMTARLDHGARFAPLDAPTCPTSD